MFAYCLFSWVAVCQPLMKCDLCVVLRRCVKQVLQCVCQQRRSWDMLAILYVPSTWSSRRHDRRTRAATAPASRRVARATTTPPTSADWPTHAFSRPLSLTLGRTMHTIDREFSRPTWILYVWNSVKFMNFKTFLKFSTTLLRCTSNNFFWVGRFSDFAQPYMAALYPQW